MPASSKRPAPATVTGPPTATLATREGGRMPASKRPAPSTVKGPPTPAKPAAVGGRAPPMPPPLAWTPASLAAAADRLAALHPTLAALRAAHGVPTARLLPVPPSDHFGTLARAIVGQQVSGAAAATIHSRVLAAAGTAEAPRSGNPPTTLLTPQAVASTPTEALRAAGLSERKAGYVKALAAAFTTGGHLADVDLSALDGPTLAARLTAVPGVGAWTADMFAIFALGRPDVLPVGDLGIRKGVAALFQLGGTGLPNAETMERLTAEWAPHRSLACWWLWRLASEGGGGGSGGGRKKRRKV